MMLSVLGVAGVAVHMPVGVGSAAVREEVHQLVNSLMVVAEVVPELLLVSDVMLGWSDKRTHHGSILEVCLGVALLGVDEEGEVDGVPKEEDGRVVVPIIRDQFRWFSFR